jgi:hypothetical protein
MMNDPGIMVQKMKCLYTGIIQPWDNIRLTTIALGKEFDNRTNGHPQALKEFQIECRDSIKKLCMHFRVIFKTSIMLLCDL